MYCIYKAKYLALDSYIKSLHSMKYKKLLEHGDTPTLQNIIYHKYCTHTSFTVVSLNKHLHLN